MAIIFRSPLIHYIRGYFYHNCKNYILENRCGKNPARRRPRANKLSDEHHATSFLRSFRHAFVLAPALAPVVVVVVVVVGIISENGIGREILRRGIIVLNV